MIERGLAHELGGKVTLDYRAEGIVCTIYIPAPHMTDDQPLAGKHILIVEDEMLVLMAIEDMMSDLGAGSVTAAATVEQALNLISVRHYDFATVDVNLGGVRSDPVADALGADNVPFAFSTGYGNPMMEGGYREQLVLRKPYSSDSLKEVVN